MTSIDWTPSANLPATPVSFADVSGAEMLERARALVPQIRERAQRCEDLRRLPDDTERDLHASGLFRMVQPRRIGGAELDLAVMVQCCAEIARVCPSTAWNVGNLSSHHWMLGYFPPPAQHELWSRSPDVLIATSLVFPAGRGRKVDGGYIVSGRWPFSSGVDNCDWNCLACTIRDESGAVVDHRFALLHCSQFTIVDNWHAMGLCGTGSADVEAKDVFVPTYRTLAAMAFAGGGAHPGAEINPGPLFRLPMLALGSYVLSGVLLGCAQGAYELVVGAARKRNATLSGLPFAAAQAVQIKVAEAAGLIDTAELIMLRNCRHGMEVARAGAAPQMADKLRYRRDAALAARMCLQAVDIMMTLAGGGGLYNTGDMQRLFRDAHAAAAHAVFSFDTQGTMFGQHALGVPGPAPVL